MVVGWSEVEGGELATREGTRSGVPPLKHAAFSSPLYLSAPPPPGRPPQRPNPPEAQRQAQPHRQRQPRIPALSSTSPTHDLRPQPFAISHPHRAPPLTSPTECRQHRGPRRRRRRPRRHELPLAIHVLCSLDTAARRAAPIRQLAPLVRRQHGRAGRKHRRKWPGHRRPAPDRGGDCKDQAIRGWSPSPTWTDQVLVGVDHVQSRTSPRLVRRPFLPLAEAPPAASYDVLTEDTDWVQDAAREQLRRKARRKRHAGRIDTGRMDWRFRIQESYEAAQGWIVITIIGVAIGMNAAFLNIITEWLADIKLGHCKKAFYLNEDFCCWGEDKGRRPNPVLCRRAGY